MEVIKQTNRTMLFEEVNPQKQDLITLIGDVKGLDSLDDDKIKEIHEHLLVNNFDDFIQKFEPVVYSYFDANSQRVMYTLEKPESIPDEMITTIPLNKNNDFLNMLFTLIDTKSSQGIINADFKFENLLDIISPKKVMDDIKRIRKELRTNYQAYIDLDDEDPKKLDLADTLNEQFEEASANYNNVMAMLPLAIEDIKTRLLLGQGEGQKDSAPLLLGVLNMGDDGELKVLEAPKADTTAVATIDDNANAGLIAELETDYDEVNGEGSSSYVRSLVVRSFCPLPSTNVQNIDVDKEVGNYNTYLEFYKNAKDDFIKVVKPLVEKILGVKVFFEQHTTKSKKMMPSMLITNISNDMMARGVSIPRLVTYLNTVNGKNEFDNTVWFSIIPSISLDTKVKKSTTRQRFKGNVEKVNTNVTSMETLSRLLDVFKDYKIQTFFNFETGENTTFNSMATEGIERIQDKCQAIIESKYSEYAVVCMPNFTIIPKNKSSVLLDSKMVIDGEQAKLSPEKEDIMKLWIEGVYVGAAYGAAGLVAAYQCPDYLKDIYKKNVDPALPGVRYDIEKSDNSLKTTTTMAKEITGFTSTIKDDINRRNFGFIFSSENASVDGDKVNRIMVYKARSLQADGNDFEPIYKTTVSTYIERVLRYYTGDFKHDSIVQFFSNNPNSQKSKWNEKKHNLNGIIGEGDDITFTIDEASNICELNITFNGNVKNLEVEINRQTAAQ